MTFQVASSRPLPPYRAVLAVDAKDFTKLPSSAHEDTSSATKKVVGDALRDAGLEAEWSSLDFFGDTGDGFAVRSADAHPSVPDRSIPAMLQKRLAQRRIQQPEEVPLRLRVSVHVGPLPADPASLSSTGNGAARNDTHRLLDADVVKEALRDASPEITLVAMIASLMMWYTGATPQPLTCRPGQRSKT